MDVNHLTNVASMHVVGLRAILSLIPVMIREAVTWKFKPSGVIAGTFLVKGSAEAVDRIQFYYLDNRR